MTFSPIVRDGSRAGFGAVVCSSSPRVASRCLHLRAGVSAVVSQNVTDPLLGQRLLDLLAGGRSAPEAIAVVTADDPQIEYRQIAAVDSAGRSATYSGPGALGLHAQHLELDLAAVGNLLAHEGVVAAMAAGYASSAHTAMEERLLGALGRALDAGGETAPLRSAVVAGDRPRPVTGPKGSVT